MKSFLITGLIVVPLYFIGQSISDTFVCGGLTAILCCNIDRAIEDWIKT